MIRKLQIALMNTFLLFIQNNDIDPLTFVKPVSKTFHFENVTVQVLR